jgi:hypothetical protein
VVATSDLRAPRRRLVQLQGDDGRRVLGYFPLSAASPDCAVYSVDAQGRKTTLLEGRDDLLRATLVAGLEAMRTGSVPWLASAQFAGVVLVRLAEAVRLAKANVQPEDVVTLSAGDVEWHERYGALAIRCRPVLC